MYRHKSTCHGAQGAGCSSGHSRPEETVQHAQGHDAGGPVTKVLADLSVASHLGSCSEVRSDRNHRNKLAAYGPAQCFKMYKRSMHLLSHTFFFPSPPLSFRLLSFPRITLSRHLLSGE